MENKFLKFSFFKKTMVLLVFALLLIPNIEAKTYSKKECKKYAYNLVIKKYHWTIKQYNDLEKLWQRESGWNAKAYNRRSKSCGIAQATPCSKMKSYGKDYKTNCKVQIKWGLNYIKRRYKNPTKAWKSVKTRGWY